MKTTTRSKKRNTPKKRPTSAWIEQQRLMEIPTEWEIDPQTCKIGLEAIAHIRTILSASSDHKTPSQN